MILGHQAINGDGKKEDDQEDEKQMRKFLFLLSFHFSILSGPRPKKSRKNKHKSGQLAE